ncbi:MAG: NAD(P)-binding domain-containing protein [Bacteroidales bacterium]|nr:NAD(P)-binding domain-containing protein [Bacteroidales bacterium]
MAKNITVIGLGQMGSALALVAAKAGNRITAVGTPQDKDIIDVCINEGGRHPKIEQRFPENVSFRYSEDWKEACEGADFVIGAISSFGVDWFLEEILSRMDTSVPVVSAAKGLVDQEDGSLISYPEYWEQKLSAKGIKRDIYAIGGPGTAEEIRRGEHTHVAVCGPDNELLLMMKSALETDTFHISLTKDVHGLESAVAIKNAYALGVAMAIGYCGKAAPEKSHFNSQAAAFYQAAKEMVSYLKAEKASEDSIMIGLGDLYVTVTGARTRKIGVLLGEGKSYAEATAILSGMTLESIVIIKRLARAVKTKAALGLVNLSDFPMLTFVDEVLEEDRIKDFPWKSFTFQDI